MNELQLQDKYLTHFFCERSDGLGYKESQANTVTKDLFLESDLLAFLKDTSLNRDSFKKLLKSYSNDEVKAMADIREFLGERRKDATNMALFINNNKTFTFKGIKFYLFYPSGGEFNEVDIFDENIFSIVQEFSYPYKHNGKQLFIFRPDLTMFLNGIFLGYSELKSNFNNQNAKQQGRKKVVKDYLEATKEYLGIVKDNDASQTIRKDFLKIFEKAIHITATDIGQTYIIRTISHHFQEIRNLYDEGKYDFETYKKKCLKDFKAYPVSDKRLNKTAQFEEVFRALYSKEMIEKEILYYNFIEKEVVKDSKGKKTKNEKGLLIAPRPKQKFGTDKILAKIDELLEHETDDNYFLHKLEAELTSLGISDTLKQELIEKRQRYQNNKNIYSLLLQYAAGFGKSNIIGWSTLQLKDLKRNDAYVYDKVMIIVDRLQLRDQIGDKMFNMNINNRMFIEANSKDTFLQALKSDTRIVIVNIQKFATVESILSEEVISRLNNMRIVFLIDEIHRSNTGTQHEEMISLFDDLQSSFDVIKGDHKKKNLIIGFTATPSDHTLARFGEYNKYAESEKIWVPFDSYTMKEAIEDGYILNPLRGIVPVSAKMYFEEPENALEGFEGDLGYEIKIPKGEDTGVDAEGKKYAIRKKKIYENPERITAISKFIVNRLVTTVYPKIRGYGKAMLAVSSIKSAIIYKQEIDKFYSSIIKKNKYSRFGNAPIYIVYSSSQEYSNPNNFNDGLTEEQVLKSFALQKNGLIIVVDKLQTGFDEKKLQTLFLDKEIRGINAIQTISRVNRTTKYKNDCKIIDFSYKNVNVKNIKEAFEHFSNVVISNFDPLGDEKLLIQLYEDLILANPFTSNFAIFEKESRNFSNDTNKILDIEDDLSRWIKNNDKHAKELKNKINQYFRILNNIEFVIDLEPKYSNKIFLDFWKRYNNEYNNINKSDDVVDDVIIYYDNRIGIIEANSNDEIEAGKAMRVKDEHSGNSVQRKFRFNILDVIEKRNQEEANLEKMIKDFENKIEKMFKFIKYPNNGKRLIAKMTDTGNAFDEDEIYHDFELLYKKFIRRNRKELGSFFIKETKELTKKLCDDFEEWITKRKQ